MDQFHHHLGGDSGKIGNVTVQNAGRRRVILKQNLDLVENVFQGHTVLVLLIKGIQIDRRRQTGVGSQDRKSVQQDAVILGDTEKSEGIAVTQPLL